MPGTNGLCVCEILHVLSNTYRTLGTCTQGNLLLAKTTICIISVVKAICVEDKAATGSVWREISVSVATNRPFRKTICYFPR